MPLNALVNGTRVYAPAISETEWIALRTAVRLGDTTITMLECGLLGYLKRSKYGLQHFTHKPDQDCHAQHAGESESHLAAKAVIVAAALEAGWKAEVEYAGDGWIADVFAEHQDTKIAFEVQWSKQTWDEYGRRQARYVSDGIRGAWFSRHGKGLPSTPIPDIPAFLLERDVLGDFQITVGSQVFELGHMVHLLLGGKVQYRDSFGNNVTVVVECFRYRCWKCDKECLVWDANDWTATGVCGTSVETESGISDIWAANRPEEIPGIVAKATEVAEEQDLPLAHIGIRSSKMAQSSYCAFSCPSCNALFGDFFLRDDLIEMRVEENVAAQFSMSFPGKALHSPHWCVDVGLGHCSRDVIVILEGGVDDFQDINSPAIFTKSLTPNQLARTLTMGNRFIAPDSGRLP